LRTLLHRPELGAIVKRLYIRGRLTDSKLDSTDVEALARRGTSISDVKYTEWLAFLSQSTDTVKNCQASTVLLLSYCFNLESLALERDGHYTLPLTSTWEVKVHVNHTTSPIFNLTKLKSLKSIESVGIKQERSPRYGTTRHSSLVSSLFHKSNHSLRQ
jgi:hypothetical protein